jgi:hypothetical protein
MHREERHATPLHTLVVQRVCSRTRAAVQFQADSRALSTNDHLHSTGHIYTRSSAPGAVARKFAPNIANAEALRVAHEHVNRLRRVRKESRHAEPRWPSAQEGPARRRPAGRTPASDNCRRKSCADVGAVFTSRRRPSESPSACRWSAGGQGSKGARMQLGERVEPALDAFCRATQHGVRARGAARIAQRPPSAPAPSK